jgi:hypothetical protein
VLDVTATRGRESRGISAPDCHACGLPGSRHITRLLLCKPCAGSHKQPVKSGVGPAAPAASGLTTAQRMLGAMSSVVQTAVPDFSLLRTFRAPIKPTAWDQYQDCFTVAIDRPVTLAQFIHAFYTTVPFTLERLLIAALIGKSATILNVQALAAGQAQDFSAWIVLARTENQILLGDYRNSTRSWLAVAPQDANNYTRLYFGSGIRSVSDPTSGQPRMTWGFRALGGFHIRYSKVLLSAARRKLQARR